MNIKSIFSIGIALVAMCAHAQPYTGTTLGSLSPTGTTIAKALNDNRVVVGHSRDINNQQRPVKWENGVLSDLGALPGVTSADSGIAVDINNSGWILGMWYGTRNRPFVVSPSGTMTEITPPGYTSGDPYRINRDGVVVGSCRASIYGDPYLFTYNVNTGTYAFYGQYYRSGFIFNNAQQTVAGPDRNVIKNLLTGSSFTIPTPTSYYEPVYEASNTFGAIAGSCRNTVNGFNRACIFRPYQLNGSVGSMEFIPNLGIYEQSYIKGMNEWGWVVGYAYNNPTYTGAFIWKGGGNAIDLNVHKPANIPGRLLIALGINTRGDIVVNTNQSGPDASAILFAN